MKKIIVGIAMLLTVPIFSSQETKIILVEKCPVYESKTGNTVVATLPLFDAVFIMGVVEHRVKVKTTFREGWVDVDSLNYFDDTFSELKINERIKIKLPHNEKPKIEFQNVKSGSRCKISNLSSDSIINFVEEKGLNVSQILQNEKKNMSFNVNGSYYYFNGTNYNGVVVYLLRNNHTDSSSQIMTILFEKNGYTYRLDAEYYNVKIDQKAMAKILLSVLN
jgi:hypothetical protein